MGRRKIDIFQSTKGKTKRLQSVNMATDLSKTLRRQSIYVNHEVVMSSGIYEDRRQQNGIELERIKRAKTNTPTHTSIILDNTYLNTARAVQYQTLRCKQLSNDMMTVRC